MSIEEEKSALTYFLQNQRNSVRSIVEGLRESDWHRPVVPSGWTVAGIVEHLGGAERHWFQGVVTGEIIELPWDVGRPPYDPVAALVCERPSVDILAYYQEQCDASDAILANTTLDAGLVGWHEHPNDEHPANVRRVVLHMIEETAAHSGHLEIARELFDGRTALGGR
jgi:hypothetical protein